MSNRKGDSAGASSVAGSASPNTNASNPTTQTTTPGTAAGIRESAKPSGPRRTAEAPGG